MTNLFQELHCHHCDKYCRFPTDTTMNGNVTVICRNCGHEHYRHVVNGEVTNDRWIPQSGNRQHTAPRHIRSQIAQKDAMSGHVTNQKTSFLRQSWLDRFG